MKEYPATSKTNDYQGKGTYIAAVVDGEGRFAKVPERKHRTNFMLSKDELSILEFLCKRTGLTVSGLFRALLTEYAANWNRAQLEGHPDFPTDAVTRRRILRKSEFCYLVPPPAAK